MRDEAKMGVDHELCPSVRWREPYLKKSGRITSFIRKRGILLLFSEHSRYTELSNMILNWQLLAANKEIRRYSTNQGRRQEG
jgi:hypothetical protein